MWHLGMWVSDGLGSIRLVVELNGIKFSNLNNSMFLTYERRKRPVVSLHLYLPVIISKTPNSFHLELFF